MVLILTFIHQIKAIETTNMNELREKSVKLTGYLEFLVDHYFNDQSNSKAKVDLITPRNPDRRGCQLSFKFNCDIALIYK